jgi:hypothetical protein
MSHGGRITCSRCGANNFETVTACWKCGSALGTAAPPAAAGPATNQTNYAAPYREEVRPQPAYAPTQPAAAHGDQAAATRAAIMLALTLPFIGLPVGWVMVMLENPRHQRVGKICANWSAIGLVVHLLLSVVLFQGIASTFKQLLPVIQSMQQRGGGTDDQRLPGGGRMPAGLDGQ